MPGTKAAGFSLIEVLVALAIFAVLASTIVFQTGAFGAQVLRLEDKTVALWVAQNAIDEVRIGVAAGASGDSDAEVEMAGREWVVTRSVTDTGRPGFRRIDVGVARAGEDGALVSLSGFVSER